MLAKIASDYRKPDGLFTIPPERIEEFVAGLPVERFFGIGEVTAEKMHRLGIRTGADLRLWNEAALVQQFGKAGHSYYGYARGIDEREVTPNRSASRSEPKRPLPKTRTTGNGCGSNCRPCARRSGTG